MTLDFQPLANAIAQLEKSLAYESSPAALADAGLREQLRNSVIQCFKFTYELTCKTLRRYVEAAGTSPAALDMASFQNLIRLGNEHALLKSEWNTWKAYRQARAYSIHAYEASKAEAVFSIAPQFLEEARVLLGNLQRRST